MYRVSKHLVDLHFVDSKVGASGYSTGRRYNNPKGGTTFHNCSRGGPRCAEQSSLVTVSLLTHSLTHSLTHRLGLAQVADYARQEGRLANERGDVARRGGRVEVRLRQVRRRRTGEEPAKLPHFGFPAFYYNELSQGGPSRKWRQPETARVNCCCSRHVDREIQCTGPE